MSSKRALQIVLGISLFGVAFSGRLTYGELFDASAAVCPSPGAPGTILGYPACVYGLFMYLLIAATAAWGLRARNGSGVSTKRRPKGESASTRPVSQELHS